MSLDIYLKITVDTGGNMPHVITLFDANITHNVAPMWAKAGIYEALYESAGRLAGDTLPALRAGLSDMAAHPDKYRALDAPNGWGTYKDALPWLEKLVAAFALHPKAIIRVSR